MKSVIARGSFRLNPFNVIAISFLCSLLMFACPISADAKTSNSNDSIEITISAAGDCTLGSDSRYNRNFDTYFSKYGSSYFLRNVKKVFSKDDLTLVNFEGTLTTSSRRASKTFTFKGPSKYARILTSSSVEVANLANNHSMDYLSKGFSDTKRTLIRNKIAYCYKTTIAYKSVKGVKVAILGFNELDGVTKSQIKTGIYRAKKKGAKIIIVNFHWGIEKRYTPTSNQRSLGKYAIRSGAALVIGHHPHVLQGIQKYRGKYIVYSLGNFCFGGNSNPSDKDTMIFQQTFTIKNGKLSTKRNAKVIACSLSGRSYTNNYQPRTLSGSSKKRVLAKIRRLSSGMNVRIDSSGNIK